MRVLPTIFYLLFLTLNLAHAQASISIGQGTNKRQTNLDSIEIDNEILGDILIQKYKLVFYNDGNSSTEGQLICPLPEGARIVEYSMDVFGQKRDGVVVSAKKARFAYEDIVRQKTDPGIVEIDEENNLFKMRVFPIESHKTKTVWLTTIRMIENGKVDLALESFGAAMTNKTSITISNLSAPPTAKGWTFEESQKDVWTAKIEYKKKALKPCFLVVKSLPSYLEWTDKGTKYITVLAGKNTSESYLKKVPIPDTKLWWDGSIKANFKILSELQQWLIWKKSGTIQLTIFRDKLENKETFTIINGKCDALMNRLQKIIPHGMARPSILPWNVPHDGVIIVSDGQFAEGYQDIPEKLDFPLFTILEQSGENYLKDLSTLSQNHGFRALGLTSISYGETKSHRIYSGISKGSVIARKHKASYWLWAHQYAKKLKAKSAPNSEISTFHTQHQVADTNHSWIVLENIHQHIQYNIPPPQTHPELALAWKTHKDNTPVKEARRLLDYASLWQKRCHEITKINPLYKKFAKSFITDDVTYWLSMPHQIIKLTSDEKTYLQNTTKEITTETDENTIYNQLKKYTTYRDKLFSRLEMMHITVRGHIKNRDPILVQIGTPIKTIVDLAEPTVFAAQNRVELQRNGKFYRYNMKIREHQIEKIYPNDIIILKEKNMWGKGGNENTTQKSPPPTRKLNITKTKYLWDEQKTYLQTLSKIPTNDQIKWFSTYLELKEKFGWRADFYEDIICYLLDKKAQKLTSKIAQDLAELHPDNPEILRRTARAFFRNDQLPIAKRIFQRIAFLTNNSETSLYDLARLHEREKDYKPAASLYLQALKCKRPANTESRAIVYLEDMNACIHKGNLTAADLNIDPELVRHIPLDIKVNLTWDSTESNIDFIVKNSLLEIYQGTIHQNKYNYWKHSGNVSQGLGPESSSLRKRLTSDYTLSAKFQADWNVTHTSHTTVSMEVIRNFGSHNETRESVTRRLQESEQATFMNLVVEPNK